MHRALDALGAFVRRTGVANALQPHAAEVAALHRPRLYRRQAFMAIDPATRKHLELLRAQGQNPRATLLASLDRCATSMGSRMLARWIVAPLLDRDALNERQECVAALVEEHARRDALRELLDGCFDLERIAQKVRFRRAAPRDLASLRRTLDALRPLPQVAPARLARCSSASPISATFSTICRRTLVDEPPAQLGDGGVIRPDADPELSECVVLRTDVRSKLSELEERERERTGIKTSED